MLRKNPNLVDDIAKQVADEMAKKASGLYDDDIEVSAEGGGGEDAIGLGNVPNTDQGENVDKSGTDEVTAEEITQIDLSKINFDEEGNETYEALYGLISGLGDTGVYYFDFSGSGSKIVAVEVGFTVVINLDDEYIAEYQHLGAGINLSPADLIAAGAGYQISVGQIYGNMEKPENYEGVFLQGGYTLMVAGADAAIALGKVDDSEDRVSQRGFHISASTDAVLSAGGTFSYYDLYNCYDMSQY